MANIGSCVGPQNKIGHPARRHRQVMQVPALSARGIFFLLLKRLKNMYYCVSGLIFRICEREKKVLLS